MALVVVLAAVMVVAVVVAAPPLPHGLIVGGLEFDYFLCGCISQIIYRPRVGQTTAGPSPASSGTLAASPASRAPRRAFIAVY
jgi:hypothetical protein